MYEYGPAQAAYAHLPLSPGSIMWYQCKLVSKPCNFPWVSKKMRHLSSLSVLFLVRFSPIPHIFVVILSETGTVWFFFLDLTELLGWWEGPANIYRRMWICTGVVSKYVG